MESSPLKASFSKFIKNAIISRVNSRSLALERETSDFKTNMEVACFEGGEEEEDQPREPTQEFNRPSFTSLNQFSHNFPFEQKRPDTLNPEVVPEEPKSENHFEKAVSEKESLSESEQNSEQTPEQQDDQVSEQQESEQKQEEAAHDSESEAEQRNTGGVSV